jgi:hypothetical protein
LPIIRGAIMSALSKFIDLLMALAVVIGLAARLVVTE